jgi:hypothetical protein
MCEEVDEGGLFAISHSISILGHIRKVEGPNKCQSKPNIQDFLLTVMNVINLKRDSSICRQQIRSISYSIACRSSFYKLLAKFEIFCSSRIFELFS